MTKEQKSSAGGCLCGGVAFTVNGEIRDVVYCHCKMCRVFHGDFTGYTTADLKDLVFTADATLKWYQSSEAVKRGFCSNCGSSMLFFSEMHPTLMGITAGCIDDPTGLTSKSHIFVGSAGDYYTLHDDLPKYDTE